MGKQDYGAVSKSVRAEIQSIFEEEMDDNKGCLGKKRSRERKAE